MLSKRAVAAIDELRSMFDWVDDTSATHIVQDPDGATWWWTFAGTAANVELSTRLGGLALATPASGLAVRLADGTTRRELGAKLESGSTAVPLKPPDDIADAYKFADVLPDDALVAMLDARDRDPRSVRDVVTAPVHTHRLNDRGPRP